MGYRSWMRMDRETFNCLLGRIEEQIQRQDTTMRQAITPGERLSITLRYLATGESFSSMEYLFRISRHSIGRIVIDTCKALYQSLQPEFMKLPSTAEEWEAVAQKFERRWDFPNCIGALDGKHIVIQPPPNSGSHYFNYKGTHSIVLMALVDADLKFLYIDVGTNGRVSDGGVWGKCGLNSALMNNSVNLPAQKTLPGREMPVPRVLVADEAFGLKAHLMRPYPRAQLDNEKRIFNYRLSRARRCVENAFGVLANRLRVFRQPITIAPQKVVCITKAACALHNYLRTQDATRQVYSPNTLVDQVDQETGAVIPGSWREEPDCLLHLETTHDRNPTNDAKTIRQEFTSYFNTNGAVSWQNSAISL